MNSWISALIQWMANEQPAHALRLKTLHGFHQADIAFLNQVGLLQAVARITASDGHHHAQVRHHQTPGGVQVVVLVRRVASSVSSSWLSIGTLLTVWMYCSGCRRQPGWARQT